MPTSIRLDSQIEQRLSALAQQTQRSKAFYLKALIHEGIEELEDAYRASIVVGRIQSGVEPRYSLDEARRLIALDA